MQKNTAVETLAIAMNCSRRVDESVGLVKDTCDADELQAYGRFAGAAMASIFENVMAPIYDEHPDLAPDWYKEMNAKLSARQSNK